MNHSFKSTSPCQRSRSLSLGLSLQLNHLSCLLAPLSKQWGYAHIQSLRATRRRQWHSTPVLLPGKSHGWRSLVGYSPWGLEVSDKTERTSLSLFTSMYWRRKWQPLQCSCLENPRDGGAWWAAVYGVAQSWTRLKRLSSSSSSSRATEEILLVSSFPSFLRFLCSSGLISSHMIFWSGSGCSLDSCTSG